MALLQIVLFLLLCAVALGWIARHFRFPYPIALVIGGGARRNGHPTPRAELFIMSWCGMRGIVSLAAALALPVAIPATGEPFPERDLIVFLTFVVIATTLVLQGLTLPMLIRRLKLARDRSLEEEHHNAGPPPAPRRHSGPTPGTDTHLAGRPDQRRRIARYRGGPRLSGVAVVVHADTRMIAHAPADQGCLSALQ